LGQAVDKEKGAIGISFHNEWPIDFSLWIGFERAISHSSDKLMKFIGLFIWFD
jgi:hypothetical protein